MEFQESAQSVFMNQSKVLKGKLFAEFEGKEHAPLSVIWEGIWSTQTSNYSRVMQYIHRNWALCTAETVAFHILPSTRWLCRKCLGEAGYESDYSWAILSNAIACAFMIRCSIKNARQFLCAYAVIVDMNGNRHSRWKGVLFFFFLWSYGN